MNLVVNLLQLAMVTAASEVASAQGAPALGKPQTSGWRFSLGLAAIYDPLYEGDDQHGFSLVPDLRAYRGQEFFLSFGEGVGYKFKASEHWEFGPLARYRFTRSQNQEPNPFQISGRTRDLNGLGDVDGGFEVGGFVVFKIQPFEARLEARKGTAGHNGEILNLSGSYGHRFGPIISRLGPSLEFGSREYLDTYFGVSPEQATNSSLAVYEAPGGLKSVGINGLLIVPIFYPYTIVAIANIKQLQASVADSPLVRERGQAEQWFLGTSISFDLNSL
jgi:outer membrane protein